MSTEKKEVPSTKEVSAKDLSYLINEKRFKYAEIAQHYGIPVAAAKRAVKEAGLTMRKFKTPPFRIIHDLPQDGAVVKAEEVSEELKNIPAVTETEVEEKSDLTAKEETTTEVVELQPETTKVTEEAPATNVEKAIVETAEATQETTATEQVTEENKKEVTETETATEEATATEENQTETTSTEEEATINTEAPAENTEGFSNKPAEATDDEW